MTASAKRPSPHADDFDPYKTLDREELIDRIQKARFAMGSRLLILGHHYQQDDVIDLSDLRGDSYQLASMAATNDDCHAIIFCGVHFMAETADILANRPDRLAARGGRRIPVTLPDLSAGCSLADMADIEQVEECWAKLTEAIDVKDVTPITYVNSAASLKAFCGKNGGIVCTSSNARAALDWAFARTSRVLFFPDQHLGRNTAKAMGIPVETMPLWDPNKDDFGGNSADAIRRSKVLLWRGQCSVHQLFLPQHVTQMREKIPGVKIIVHPECRQDVVDLADMSGSTGKIIHAVDESPKGSKWAIGTELNLVNRLKQLHSEKEIHFLSPMVCMCSTMFRIDLPHLCWAAESVAAGKPVNVIEVEPETSRWALVALKRMLEVQ